MNAEGDSSIYSNHPNREDISPVETQALQEMTVMSQFTIQMLKHRSCKCYMIPLQGHKMLGRLHMSYILPSTKVNEIGES